MGEIRRKASKILRGNIKPKISKDQLLKFLSAGIAASKERDFHMEESMNEKTNKNIKDEKDTF